MKLAFSGCSFTVGEGLDFEKDDPLLYANIVAKNFSASVTNLAVKGNSNQNIFFSALSEIVFNAPDIMFVQWSGLNRLWLYPTPATKLFLPTTVTSDYQCNNIRYSKKELQLIGTYYITITST